MSVQVLAGIIAGLSRLISGVQVQWLDSAPDPSPTIYFANHTSHLDFVMLWSALPPEIRARTRPVAAQDYWEQGLRRALAVNVFRAVLVRRQQSSEGTPADPRVAIDQMIHAIGDDSSLILFPEGTRGTGEEVAPFKSGLYYLCKARPGLRLVPAYLANLNRILPKGEVLAVPFISRLTFGPAIGFEEGEPKEAFLLKARDAVCRLRNL